jgi:hypothetical protein
MRQTYPHWGMDANIFVVVLAGRVGQYMEQKGVRFVQGDFT